MSKAWVVSVARAAGRRPRRLVGAAGGAVLVVALAAAPSSGAAAAAGRASFPIVHNLSPRFTTEGGAPVLRTTRTVANWHGSFVDGLNGQTYGYNMVGSPPESGSSTTVTAEIIPLNLSFAADGGLELDASQEADWVEESPIFVPTPMPSVEQAQYLDAVMRSEFNQIGSGYHVLLTTSTPLPAESLTVPPNQGALYVTPDGTLLGLVNQAWFSAQVQSLLAGSQLDPTTLPIVVSSNVFLYQKSAATGCCTLGFHGAAHPTGMGTGSAHGNGDQPVQTFAWASWISSPQIFGTDITDVAGLSHEVAEWGHDPFSTNSVNPWSMPGDALYGCTKLLETGDPLVGVDFAAGSTNPEPLTGPAWHLQDEAFLWWFARNPTWASNRAYSYIGTLTSPAGTC
jgi:hypothetical protein